MAAHPLPSGAYRKRGQVTFDLFTGAGSSVRIGPWEGEVTVDPILKDYREPVELDDRGVHAGLEAGADIKPTLSIGFKHKGKMGDAAVATILDCLTYDGVFAGDKYTDPQGVVPTHKAVITITAPDGVDVITAPNARFSTNLSTGDVNTSQVTGTCYRPEVGGDPEDAANQPIIRS